MSEKNDQQQTLSFHSDSARSLSVLLTSAAANENGVEVTNPDALRQAIDIDGVRVAINAVSDNPAGSAYLSLTGEETLSCLWWRNRGVAYE